MSTAWPPPSPGLNPLFLVMGTLEGISLRHPSQRYPDATGSCVQCIPALTTTTTTTKCILKSVWFVTPKGRGMHCHERTSRWAPPIKSVMNGRKVERLLWSSVRESSTQGDIVHSETKAFCPMRNFTITFILRTVWYDVIMKLFKHKGWSVEAWLV